MNRLWRACSIVLLQAVFTCADAAQIGDIEVEDRAEVSKVSILLDTVAEYRVFTLADPSRLVVDVLGAANAGRQFVLHSTRIKKVRHAPRGDGDYRIVFDLNQVFQYRHRLERDDGTDAASLVLEIGTFAAVLPQPSQKKLRNLIVVIDPGHGGRDSGAVGKAGSYEKDRVLEISEKIHRFLQQQFGIDAYLTRDTDKYIALRDRIRIARDKSADIFLSIHADSLKEEYVSGSSVYILSKDGASSEAARLLAKRESKLAFVGDTAVSNEEAAVILVELLQAATLEYSVAFAKTMIETLGESFKVHRGIESAGFAVLKSLEIPSLLIEVGYLSNAEEERRLGQPRYQQRMAVAIGEGVKRYLNEHAPAESWLGSYTFSQYTVVSGDSLWHLAHRYGVSISLIRQVSGLQSDNLQVGQKLLLPIGKNH